MKFDLGNGTTIVVQTVDSGTDSNITGALVSAYVDGVEAGVFNTTFLDLPKDDDKELERRVRIAIANRKSKKRDAI